MQLRIGNIFVLTYNNMSFLLGGLRQEHEGITTLCCFLRDKNHARRVGFLQPPPNLQSMYSVNLYNIRARGGKRII
jgi:hypothetical protein